MTTFKPGDVCWHVTQGVVKLWKDPMIGDYPLYDGKRQYTRDGKAHPTDKFPTLLTLEEARARGFPVPKEPMRVEVRVEWREDQSLRRRPIVFPETLIPEPAQLFERLIGKRGVLVFTEDEGGSK